MSHVQQDLGSKSPKPAPKIYLQIPQSDQVNVEQALGSKPLKYDKLFVQLDVLSGEHEESRVWQETTRWIKYEQNVEEGADRWGRAHVSALSYHSLIGLRRLLSEGAMLLDLDEMDFPAIARHITQQMILTHNIEEEELDHVVKVLLLKHRNVMDKEKTWKFYQPKKSIVPDSHFEQRKSFAAEIGFRLRKSLTPDSHPHHQRKSLAPDFNRFRRQTSTDPRIQMRTSLAPEPHTTINVRNASIVSAKNGMAEEIPVDYEYEATLVLIGTDEKLNGPATAFVRLAESSHMPNITEIPIPVKFIFVLLGPARFDLDYKEIGRSMATLMSHKEFHNLALEADHRSNILKGIQNYLNDSIVLPPTGYEKDLFSFDDLRLKGQAVQLRRQRMSRASSMAVSGIGTDPEKFVLLDKQKMDDPPFEDGIKEPEDTKGLTRTRKFFGGFVNDIRRRYPLYGSDIRDGLNFQCFAAIVFMAFVQISGTIAFGGLLDAKTGQRIGITETLFASSVGGIVVALFGGQPLLIAASSGPILLFDAGLFTFCQDNEIDFLTMRTWIGIWLSVIAFVFVAFELSVLIRFFTRFALEVFASVISLLYIAECFINLYHVYKTHPLLSTYSLNEMDSQNGTLGEFNEGSQIANQPNTALLCTILMFGTFGIAFYLNIFKNSKFLTKTIRKVLGNFTVPIAIAVTVLIDYWVSDTFTKKLDAPRGLQPTYPRTWFVNPGEITPLIGALASLPALLLFILVFMEVSIAELMVTKHENQTVKGSGFHLDVLLICVLNTITSLFGLSWISIALVRTVTHCSALTLLSTNNAPGEKPVIIGLWEQRVTNLFVSILTGVAVMMGSVLDLIPTAVIFGVFLFMGYGGLNGIQFINRISLLFKQVRNHPEVPYVRRVRTSKMHLYTAIQLCWLALLSAINYSHIALSFALFVILMLPFRIFVLPRIFKPEELAVLDASGEEKRTSMAESQASRDILIVNDGKRMSKQEN